MSYECLALSVPKGNQTQTCTSWGDTTSPYAITLVQAEQISVAIMGVLVLAFAYRLIVRMLS
jgi:hypothetical protein